MKTKDMWLTKEGVWIPIREMASSHLLNSIHLMERRRFTNIVDCATREGEDPDLNYNRPTLQYYAQWPEHYFTLVAEAERRNLIARARVSSVKNQTSLVRKKNA